MVSALSFFQPSNILRLGKQITQDRLLGKECSELYQKRNHTVRDLKVHLLELHWCGK